MAEVLVLGMKFSLSPFSEPYSIAVNGAGFSQMNATSLNFYHDFFKKTSSVPRGVIPGWR
jgi:hypothetical protein